MNERERFASEESVDIDRVNCMCRLADECKRLGERECNGDPHPRNPAPTDKNANAKLWGHDRDIAAAELERYANAYGFTAVEFNGLRPCLKRGNRTVFIPA